MRIYSKKAFAFEDTEGKRVNVKMMDFADVPDWAADTPMFKLALKAEEIVIVNSKGEETKVEIQANEDTSGTSSSSEISTDETTTGETDTEKTSTKTKNK